MWRDPIHLPSAQPPRQQRAPSCAPVVLSAPRAYRAAQLPCGSRRRQGDPPFAAARAGSSVRSGARALVSAELVPLTHKVGRKPLDPHFFLHPRLWVTGGAVALPLPTTASSAAAYVVGGRRNLRLFSCAPPLCIWCPRHAPAGAQPSAAYVPAPTSSGQVLRARRMTAGRCLWAPPPRSSSPFKADERRCSYRGLLRGLCGGVPSVMLTGTLSLDIAWGLITRRGGAVPPS